MWSYFYSSQFRHAQHNADQNQFAKLRIISDGFVWSLLVCAKLDNRMHVFMYVGVCVPVKPIDQYNVYNDVLNY